MNYSLKHMNKASMRAISCQMAREQSRDAKIFTDDPLEAVIDRRYLELWHAVVITAVKDYVNYRPNNRAKFVTASSGSTSVLLRNYYVSAKSFLKDQHNIDLVSLDMCSRDLMRMLDNVSVEEMKKRTTDGLISV